ncbi:MAG: cysteine desulfurase family protein [Mariprofundaceae bacterium]
MRYYLDHNATSPPLQAALATMLEVATKASGNPSSLHWAGREARRALDDARDVIAGYVDAQPGSLIFTSGGTEANNLAIHGWLATQKPGRIIVSSTEHPSVLMSMQHWQQQGWDLVTLRPDHHGIISSQCLKEQLNDETRLVAIMAANNETGVVQDIESLATLCHQYDTPILVDAVQALGKVPLHFDAWQLDFMTLSAHKIGGPKGVGALFVRRGRAIRPVNIGGGQEKKRRSGTENVPAIAGFSTALQIVNFNNMQPIRDAFETTLLAAMPDIHIFGCDTERLPNTSMFHLPGIEGETLLMQLDLAGFAVASGSACSSGKRAPSHVLLAMGVPLQQAMSSIRVSFGPGNHIEDGSALVSALVAARNKMRTMAGKFRR